MESHESLRPDLTWYLLNKLVSYKCSFYVFINKDFIQRTVNNSNNKTNNNKDGESHSFVMLIKNIKDTNGNLKRLVPIITQLIKTHYCAIDVNTIQSSNAKNDKTIQSSTAFMYTSRPNQGEGLVSLENRNGACLKSD